MEDQQRENLQRMIPRMRTYHYKIEKLHQDWSNFGDGRNIKEIEEGLMEIDAIHSEADDTAKLIENGRKSYEDI